MCKTNGIHAACKAGERDGGCFDLNEYDVMFQIILRSFEDDDEREAYRCSFIAALGARMNPAALLRASLA